MPKTTYVWDELSDQVIEESEDSVVVAEYTYEPRLYGNLISQNRSGTTHYYHYDGRGDAVALTNDSGTVTDTREYDAWGNVIVSTGSTSSPYQFVGLKGYQNDSATGLQYIRARFYSGSLARWTSKDPANKTDGPNRYLTVHNSPVQHVDPSGHRATTLCSGCKPPMTTPVAIKLPDTYQYVAIFNDVALILRLLGLNLSDVDKGTLQKNQPRHSDGPILSDDRRQAVLRAVMWRFNQLPAEILAATMKPASLQDGYTKCRNTLYACFAFSFIDFAACLAAVYFTCRWVCGFGGVILCGGCLAIGLGYCSARALYDNERCLEDFKKCLEDLNT